MIIDAGFEVRLDSAWPEELAHFVAQVKAGGSAAFDIDHSGEVIRDDRKRQRHASRGAIAAPATLRVNGLEV